MPSPRQLFQSSSYPKHLLAPTLRARLLSVAQFETWSSSDVQWTVAGNRAVSSRAQPWTSTLKDRFGQRSKFRQMGFGISKWKKYGTDGSYPGFKQTLKLSIFTGTVAAAMAAKQSDNRTAQGGAGWERKGEQTGLLSGCFFVCLFDLAYLHMHCLPPDPTGPAYLGVVNM